MTKHSYPTTEVPIITSPFHEGIWNRFSAYATVDLYSPHMIGTRIAQLYREPSKVKIRRYARTREKALEKAEKAVKAVIAEDRKYHDQFWADLDVTETKKVQV
jgi:hypothetical protein